jgi:hypothetical protein
MPSGVRWLDGRETVTATLPSPMTWDADLRPGRYRLLTTAMNGQPAALA